MWHANDKKSVGRSSPADYEGKRCSAVSYSTGKLGRDPLVSPAFATDEQLRRLPSVHILGADRDVLRDQGLRFARRLDALGCPVRAEVLPGSTHLFVTVKGQPAAFARAVAFATEAMR